MSAGLTFAQKCGSSEPTVDVIFIHGLTGDPEHTWTCEDGSEFWPNWLTEEYPHIACHTLGYPAALFEKWAKKEMDIYERATSALDYMTSKGIGERPIIFIVHSLGGILLKQIIRKTNDTNDEDWQAVGAATKLVVYLSTPHTGAALASVLHFALPKLSSSHIDLLKNDNGALHDINQSYRSHCEKTADLKTVVYFEKHLTKKAVLVVNRQSADPGVVGAEPIPADKDHINICKPKDKDDIIYLGIKKHIGRVLKSFAPQNGGSGGHLAHDAGYDQKSETDRRDLLTKMIDADREHEYPIANDFQNGFARNYHKHGLYTAARDDHENLLSEIQQRFIMHVYHPLICKGANDVEVEDAIQEKVLNPISGRKIGQTVFNRKEVFTGLYFLTEQCHVRWDAPS